MRIAPLTITSHSRRLGVAAISLALLGSLVVRGASQARAGSDIVYRGASSGSNDSATSLSLDKPSGVASGDLLLAGIYVTGSPTITPPSGWTLLRSTSKAYIYDKLAGSSEASSYTWSLSSAQTIGGSVLAYSGIDSAAPIEATSGSKADRSKLITGPSVDLTTSGSLVVGFFGIATRTSITPPSSMSARVADSTARGRGITWEVADITFSSTGSTGDQVATADKQASNAGQLVALAPDSGAQGVYRAFTDSSYWNTPLPANAPIDPNSAAMMAYIEQNSTTNYISLSGTSSSGGWGQPIYWAQPSDPVYDVQATNYTIPPEFASLRIPRNAKTDDTSDHPMTIFDLTAGYVAWLWQATYDPTSMTWSAGGGSVHYLASNGLDGDWTQYPDTDPRNTGHRGVAGAVFPVRYDEIEAGAIDHVLKIGINQTKCAHVFPLVGDECGTTDANAPPEGTRIRIKRSVDLSQFGLGPAALVIAQALQAYGAVIGDQSGGPVSTKVENVVTEGRGWLWDGLLNSTSLSAIPLEDFEVIQLGYAPPG